MRRLFLLLLVAALAAGAWWYFQPELNFTNHKPLSAAVRKADRVALYEGLPNQEYERKPLEEELRAKPTVQFHDFPFYAEVLPLEEADAKQLTELFCDASSFRPHHRGS